MEVRSFEYKLQNKGTYTRLRAIAFLLSSPTETIFVNVQHVCQFSIVIMMMMTTTKMMMTRIIAVRYIIYYRRLCVCKCVYMLQDRSQVQWHISRNNILSSRSTSRVGIMTKCHHHLQAHTVCN